MIYRNELYKLLHTKVFLLILLSAFLLNIYVTCSQNFGLYCSAKEYKEYYAIAKGKTYQEAYDYSIARRDNMFAGWEGNKWAVRSMMNSQIEQLKAVGTYRQYLKAIDDTAATMTAVSIFADPNSFAYRNIIRTPSAYDRVRKVHPVFAPSNGVLLAAQNVPSDILLLFVIFTSVMVIFYKDRENGIVGLIKPLRYGRTRLSLAKTAVVFSVCLVCGAVFFLMNLWIGSIRYGLGDLSRPAQSLAGYLGCNLPISVRELLFLIFVYKILAMFVCALISQSLFIRLKNVTAYLALLLAGGIETALYLLISETSYLSPIKQINLAAFVNSSHLFRTYSNINLFGYPINLIGTTSVFIALMIAVLVLLTVRLYENISISEIKKTRRRIIKTKPPKKAFSYTLYKDLIMHKGLLILIAALAFQIYSAFNYVRPYQADDSIYNAYASQAYSLNSAREVYDFLKVTAEEITAEIKSSMNSGYSSNDIWAKRSAFERLVRQYNNAMKVSGGKNLPKYMYYTTGWDNLFGVKGFKTDYKLGLIAILGICFAISPLIAYDNRARIGFLLYATKSGRRTYFVHNAVMAAIFATVVSLAVYIPHYIQMLTTYGTQGILDPISGIISYSKLGGLPVLGYLIILTLWRLISMILFSELVLVISYKSKSPTTATVATLAAFALPIVIYLAGANFMQWLCWGVSGNKEILHSLSGM